MELSNEQLAKARAAKSPEELLALAQGALRVLRGEEKAQEYRRPRPTEA